MDRNESKTENLRRKETAETKFAAKAMIKIMVLVCNLRITSFMGMLAMFCCEFGDNMFKRVNRLKQD
jgi:hypothetical protein